MADDNSANSTSTSTEEQTLTPPPDDDPPAPASFHGGKIDKEDPDLSRDSKRRKMCPTALDKIEDFVPPNRTFSFTFDTKFSACGSDATPKFGSFQSVKEPAPLTTEDLPCKVPTEILGIREEGGEEETDVLGVFEVVEGIELNDTQFPTKMGQKKLPL
ncbi:hypothetical protein QN277_013429 [Acacia crassicarpa]|uniref:Uncharacterized protein n=1 Tax=Acacia crassicarpa TaxID=499986 RepID=A0AAE1N371_9FABA|nr:hypothetical protein QN277_013429 [Acacia crassicarpa]